MKIEPKKSSMQFIYSSLKEWELVLNSLKFFGKGWKSAY